MSKKDGKSQDTSSWAVYKRLVGYALPYRRRLLWGMLFGLVFAGANAWLLKLVNDSFKMFDVGGVPPETVIILALIVPPAVALFASAEFGATYFMKWVGNRVVMDLRNALFTHVQHLSLAFFSGSRTGEIMVRITNDTMLVERAVSTVITDIAKQPVRLIAMVIALFVLDWRLTLACFVLFPVFVIPVAIAGRKVRRYRRRAQERIGDLASTLQESISGTAIVKAFGTEDRERERFAGINISFFRRVMRVALVTAALNPIIMIIAAGGVAFVLVYVRWADMTVSDFSTYVAALFFSYEPVKKMSKLHVNIQQSSAAAERIFELLDTEVTVTDAVDAAELNADIETISLENVGFSYDKVPVLTDINFGVKAGERVAFVGGSGAGKSTLVSLLPRFFDVCEGRIAVNGSDIRELSLKSLRSKIGLVTQDTFLFNDTVANNIAYGMADASREDVETAAKRAHAHEFVKDMPDGYETIIGERGVRLSGGQKQRLAIARAILRDPPILILDEATSALDTESERFVQEALDELMKGRTVFAIAHRLSTIINCDRILVLDEGCIVEEGGHQELLAKGGIYKRLYDLQFETQCAEGIQ